MKHEGMGSFRGGGVLNGNVFVGGMMDHQRAAALSLSCLFLVHIWSLTRNNLIANLSITMKNLNTNL